MNIKVAGINGFGRFGLHFLKYWLDRSESSSFQIKFINDEILTLNDALTIINNDATVIFNKYKFSISDDKLIILQPNGIRYEIQYSVAKKTKISWLGKPDILFECSGRNTVSKDCKYFIKGKTKHIIISATSWDCDQTLIYGFNHKNYNKKKKIIIEKGMQL